jgi:uncharacterized protein
MEWNRREDMSQDMPEHKKMFCRLGCGACCIAPSITSRIPGMPEGKPAGVRCVQLTQDNLCKLFGSPLRPAVCSSLMPSEEMCGVNNQAAMDYLERLERETSQDTHH